MLYLLPDGSRVNRLLLGGWLSFSILWALCRRLTLPISLMRCRWVPMMFWVVLFTGWTWLVSVWYLCDICEPSNLNLFPAPRQLHWCRQECVPLLPFLQINRRSAPWFCWCYASLLFKRFQKYIIWKYVNTFNVANYVFFLLKYKETMFFSGFIMTTFVFLSHIYWDPFPKMVFPACLSALYKVKHASISHKLVLSSAQTPLDLFVFASVCCLQSKHQNVYYVFVDSDS